MSLLDYCKYDIEDDSFIFPEVEVFMRYKYVIATCSMAASLKNYSIPAGHFNVVFIDEAGALLCFLCKYIIAQSETFVLSGQATEPEVISSFANLIDFSLSSPQLILAGDPKQLGPIVRSEAARVGGLGLPFMERILYSSNVYAMIKVVFILYCGVPIQTYLLITAITLESRQRRTVRSRGDNDASRVLPMSP